MKGPNKAARPDDGRLSPDGPKALLTVRASKELIALAKQRAKALDTSLGKYVESLVREDMQKNPPQATE